MSLSAVYSLCFGAHELQLFASLAAVHKDKHTLHISLIAIASKPESVIGFLRAPVVFENYSFQPPRSYLKPTTPTHPTLPN